MKFEAFIALRYLRAKRKQTMVSVISVISILGIAAGVMALVIALAFSAGFKEDVQQKILGATSAINLLRMDRTPMPQYEEVLQKVSGMPHVTGIAPAIFNQVLIASSSHNQGAALKGINPAWESKVSDFLSHVIEGDAHALDKRDATGVSLADAQPRPLDKILIGKEMSRALGVNVGDTLKVIYPMGKLTPLGMTASEKTFRVAAIFESGLWDIDANWAYVHIDAARRLFSYPEGSALVLQFKIDDLENAEAIADSIRAKAGDAFTTTTWIELNKPLFSALKLERLVLFLTIGLIVFVASLNIVTTLIMMVLEKQGDIAILTAMGATGKTIQRVFMLQGLIIGLTGTVIGNVLGIGISWILDKYKLIRLEAEIYSIPYVPFHIRGWDAVLISVTALAISYLATIYPARSAAKLDPVEVLRYE
ncbi:MAG TPA: FtsX-like permease family protein [Acidobacteriota bacterium]|nr:FtsX-like permease family protein [Acidobacteriota bacterium]